MRRFARLKTCCGRRAGRSTAGGCRIRLAASGTNREAELLQLRRELVDKTYAPGPYRETIITRPKRRMISAAPFRDRVVHHAVCQVVMPLFERKMIYDLYSNRAGKGTHAAIRRAQEFCRRFDYVLKCDVRKFFPSMDHAVLKASFARPLPAARRCGCLDTIIDGSNRQEPVCQVFPGDDLRRRRHGGSDCRLAT